MAHIQLSGGQCAEIHPDGFSDHGYVLEIGGAEQSHVDVQNPDYVFYEYLRRIANAVDVLAPAGEPITAAHLGAGALTLVRYIQATRPGSRQVAVDIEPELMGFVKDRLPLPAGTDCQLVVGDAREQLANLPEVLGVPGFDAIILDIFTGMDAPAHLANRDFYRELKDALSERGMVAINVGDDAGLPFFQLQAAAMLEVFDHVWCLCESSMISGQSEGNLVLVGTARELDEDTQDWLYALGPHPAEVLTTDELRDLLDELAES